MADRVNKDHVFYRNPTKYYPPAARGEGIYIYDDAGKRYIDGSGGAVVSAIGHGVKEIEAAMVRQLNQIDFTHGTQFTSRAAASLAEILVRIAPASLERVYFLSG
ncbi:MAG: aminotransferase class III-fold pyridoxal phosphate-dependent enzyme, partial [Syntrophaceae bacterium]|nr:aminotransferase class III-fold pyridoxal phosphate-dependent enzyme [Syntrophaceae bacterium]